MNQNQEVDRLPLGALLVLAATGFSAIVTETLPAGLLPQVASDFGVSQGAAGQLVTIYALGSVAAAIPLVTLTQSLPRKPLLIAALMGLLLGNLISAASHSYQVTLVARFCSGVAAGLGWGMLGGYARRMVVDRLKGRALALAMAGTPLALAVGVPLGTFAGGAIGWRVAVFATCGLLLLLIVAAALWMPNSAGQPPDRKLSNLAVLRLPGVTAVLATAFTWVTAHYILYTYVAPYAAWAGYADSVGLLLLFFGVAAIGGIWISGVMVERHLRLHVLTSLIAFAATTMALALVAHGSIMVFAAIIVWGVTFGGAATSIQTAASDAAGEGVDLVGAMLTTVWNSAIAAGGAIGAMLLQKSDVRMFFPVMLLLILAALAMAFAARVRGFRSGDRATR